MSRKGEFACDRSFYVHVNGCAHLGVRLPLSLRHSTEKEVGELIPGLSALKPMADSGEVALVNKRKSLLA